MWQGPFRKESRVEVEAIRHVRHKNLVRRLGYCVEGSHRTSVTCFCFISSKCAFAEKLEISRSEIERLKRFSRSAKPDIKHPLFIVLL